MTENAYTRTDTAADIVSDAALADRATWAINSLLEAGEEVLAADLAATYEDELRLSRAS